LVLRDRGRGDVRVEVFFELAVGGHLVLVAALLVQPDVPAFAARVVVLDLH